MGEYNRAKVEGRLTLERMLGGMWTCSRMCWKRKDKGDTKASSLHFALDAMCKDVLSIEIFSR